MADIDGDAGFVLPGRRVIHQYGCRGRDLSLSLCDGGRGVIVGLPPDRRSSVTGERASL